MRQTRSICRRPSDPRYRGRSRKQMTNGEGQGEGRLLALALLALVAGALAGFVGASFRLCLEQSDRLRDVLIARAHGWEAVGFLLVLTACAAATALAAWLVRRYSPHASGSGIPHVEAVLRGELPQAPFRLIPVKFFGGLLAIGSGLRSEERRVGEEWRS